MTAWLEIVCLHVCHSEVSSLPSHPLNIQAGEEDSAESPVAEELLNLSQVSEGLYGSISSKTHGNALLMGAWRRNCSSSSLRSLMFLSSLPIGWLLSPELQRLQRILHNFGLKSPQETQILKTDAHVHTGDVSGLSDYKIQLQQTNTLFVLNYCMPAEGRERNHSEVAIWICLATP